MGEGRSPPEVNRTAGYSPVPLSGTSCGLPTALSLNLRFEVRVPAALGRKLTLTVQELPGANPAPPIGQFWLATMKLLAFPPLAEMLLMIRGAVPLFVIVTVCGALVVPRA